MKEIYEKIITAFDEDASLAAIFPSGLLHDNGYDSQNLPVAIFAGISDVSTYSTCDELSELLIQFTVFTSTDSECFDAIDLIKDVFDDISLPLINISPISMVRVGGIPPRKIDDAWRGTLDYRILTQI